MVQRIDYSGELFDNFEVTSGIPLSFLLSKLYFDELVIEIQNRYYSEQISQRFHYPIELMLKLCILKCFRKVSFRLLPFTLTDEDCEYLFPQTPVKDLTRIPSPSTIHHFVNYRLKAEGMKFVMDFVGKQIVHLLNLQNRNEKLPLIIDSTPLEASRYSKISPKNPYYGIPMDKAHIVSMGGYPAYMIFSGGLESDVSYAHLLIDALQPMQPKSTYCICDGAYDKYTLFADIFVKLGTTPVIAIRKNAVFSDMGKMANINDTLVSLWKQGGDKNQKIESKLKFLYNAKPRNGESPDKYKKIVGGYLRNQLIIHEEEYKEILKMRGLCEQKHAQFKNTVKFDVKGYRADKRELYVLLNFISIQCVMLAYLQNNSQNTAIAGFL